MEPKTVELENQKSFYWHLPFVISSQTYNSFVSKYVLYNARYQHTELKATKTVTGTNLGWIHTHVHTRICLSLVKQWAINHTKMVNILHYDGLHQIPIPIAFWIIIFQTQVLQTINQALVIHCTNVQSQACTSPRGGTWAQLSRPHHDTAACLVASQHWILSLGTEVAHAAKIGIQITSWNNVTLQKPSNGELCGWSVPT